LFKRGIDLRKNTSKFLSHTAAGYMLLISCLLLFFNETCLSQVTIKGTIKDSASQETLVGVIVSVDDTVNTTTDLNGSYKIKVQKGTHKLVYSFVTYNTVATQITVTNDTVMPDFALHSTSQGLEAVVVSASMYEKSLAEENVSMAVIKPSEIENTGAREMDDAINNVPGVNVTDGQASIRGGSGWAYGAGSRVLLLVDGLPELTADASDVIWDFLPIEETQQVEIIKGAASVLYGSSALDGVINVRTAFPTSTPVTTFNFFEGVYSNPNVPGDSVPWNGQQQPRFDGFTFMHSQRFNQLDLVCSGNVYSEQNYLEGAYDQRARVSLNLRYRFKKISGLMVGVRTSYMYQHTGTYLAWENDSSGILRPLGGTGASSSVVDGIFLREAIDPYINYNAPDGSRITVQGRYFLSNNSDYGSTDGSIAELYYGEAKYQKDFKFHLTITAGVATTLNTVEAQLYGIHKGSNVGEYLQLEQKFGNLTITGGIRHEINKVDSIVGSTPIVFRAGANYKLAKATFLRASYGEGYRFPSIAEQFISTTIGGAIPIFPNPSIQPETGYSAEIGINQGMKIGSWQGVADLAAFNSIYKNLIDFSFGFWYPPGTPVSEQMYIKWLGFKSVNIDNAQIKGLELTYTAAGKIGRDVHVELTAGATAIDPINTDTKDSVQQYEASHPNLSSSQKDSLQKTEILNYRSLYTAKLAFELSYKKFTLGGNYRYNSFIVNMDKIFLGTDPQFPGVEVVPGVARFRELHGNGDYIIDGHLAYQATKIFKISFIVKNLLNRAYIERPAYLEPPRNFTLQVGIRF